MSARTTERVLGVRSLYSGHISRAFENGEFGEVTKFANSRGRGRQIEELYTAYTLIE